jgi:hypothetical protein
MTPEIPFNQPQRPTVIVTDFDHVVSSQRPPMRDGMLDVNGYRPETQEILTHLCEEALNGTVVHISTGKGVNSIPIGAFFYRNTMDLAVSQGKADKEVAEGGLITYRIRDEWKDPATGRLLANDKIRPVMCIFSMKNGGWWTDLLDPKAHTVEHPLPLDMWEKLAQPAVAQLIQDSTTDARRVELAGVTPEYKKSDDYQPIAQQPVDESLYDTTTKYGMRALITAYQQRIGHVGCVTPEKINFIFDMQKIIHSKNLLARWGKIAQQRILTQEEQALPENQQEEFASKRLLRAMDTLLPGVEIFRAYAHGTNYFDIAAADKGTNILEVKEHVGQVYQSMGLPLPNYQFAIGFGDGHPVGSNDAALYEQITKQGGVALTTKHHPEHSVPLYIHNTLQKDDIVIPPETDDVGLTYLFIQNLANGALPQFTQVLFNPDRSES